MRIILPLLLCCFILTHSFGQTQRKVSAYLSFQYNSTIYDRTAGNNPWSVGLGLQAFVNTKTAFKPTIDLTADYSIADDKLSRLTPDNKPIDDADGVIYLFAGSSFQPTPYVYVSFVLGPSFINRNTYFGIKPFIGIYFSKSQRVTGRISYINVFNREQNYQETKKDDFGSVSFAIAFKLF